MTNNKTVLFLIFLLTLTSCGVILDTGKITGAWQLVSSEYYLYNEVTDSYITILGDATTDGYKTKIGALFYSDSFNIIMTFDNNGEFTISEKITDPQTTNYIVNKPSGTWSIDSYENTLSLSVTEDIRPAFKNKYNFWSSGLTLKKEWPLSDLISMELIITASDIGEDTIAINKTPFKAKSMKGYFKKI